MFKNRFAAAFESGHYKGTALSGTPIDYHQTEISRHYLYLSEDYRIAREEFGMNTFRDGAWLQTLFLAPDQYDWTYLDKLAQESKGQTYLAICHYEWPKWITEPQILNEEVISHMCKLSEEIAKRYGKAFAGYYPIVEATYWVSRMTRDGLWWPAYGPNHQVKWWQMYKIVMKMFICMAQAIKSVDPTLKIGMSEPWNWYHETNFDSFSRPFNTVRGISDATAIRELGKDIEGGSEQLLDIIGLNFYGGHGIRHGWPLHKIIFEARNRFPYQEISIGETSFGFEKHIYNAESWAELVDIEVSIANEMGAKVTDIFWAPFIDFFGEDLKPMPGGLVWVEGDDLTRKWDSKLARRFKKEGN